MHAYSATCAGRYGCLPSAGAQLVPERLTDKIEAPVEFGQGGAGTDGAFNDAVRSTAIEVRAICV